MSLYNQRNFIEGDPISIPHRFVKKEDVEIAGFWTAMLSWGQRKTIISKATELFGMMDNSPHDFILNGKQSDWQRLEVFKHRTFLADDTFYFMEALKAVYQQFDSLEDAFIPEEGPSGKLDFMYHSLTHFHAYFFSRAKGLDRTKKHIPSPSRGSTCKRLHMFLRWMVRQDDRGVDLGIWKKIFPESLMIPYDVHVDRVARTLNLVTRKQTDWKTVEEITAACRYLDPHDPAKYDYALFGLSVTGDLWLH